MMNYNEFTEALLRELPDLLSQKYQDCQINLIKDNNINQESDYITVRPKEQTGSWIVPRFCVQVYYDYYKECGNMTEVLKHMEERICERSESAPDILSRIDRSTIISQVIFTLIHREQNQELLKNLPHRAWNDLAIVYRWMIDQQEGINSLITWAMAERFGMDEESLYSAAYQNTIQLNPPKVKSMSEVLREMKSYFSDMLDPADTDESCENSPMYVISNQEGIYGAAMVLYENILYKLAEQTGSDLYILPASLHEVIAVLASDSVYNQEELAEIVGEVNGREVSLEERLSNQVYFYSRQTREITMATSLPFKGL